MMEAQNPRYSVRSNISFSITKGVSYAMEEYFPLSVVLISISFLLSAVFQGEECFHSAYHWDTRHKHGIALFPAIIFRSL